MSAVCNLLSFLKRQVYSQHHKMKLPLPLQLTAFSPTQTGQINWVNRQESRVEEKFSWDGVAHQLSELYIKLLKEPAKTLAQVSA
jgi:glycogen synthase